MYNLPTDVDIGPKVYTDLLADYSWQQAKDFCVSKKTDLCKADEFCPDANACTAPAGTTCDEAGANSACSNPTCASGFNGSPSVPVCSSDDGTWSFSTPCADVPGSEVYTDLLTDYSWQQAKDFCVTKGADLCQAKDYCPDGPGKAQLIFYLLMRQSTFGALPLIKTMSGCRSRTQLVTIVCATGIALNMDAQVGEPAPSQRDSKDLSCVAVQLDEDIIYGAPPCGEATPINACS
eukprot:gene13095-3628_t